MTTILDAPNNQPLAPDLAAEVAALVADIDEIVAYYQAQGQDPSDNWDFEEALNALGAALYSNNVDEIGLPDGRIVTTYRFAQRHSFLGINIYSQESVVDAYIAHDEKKPVKETY